jgi:hypothetical protein
MTKPSVFISHRHADAKIAAIIADFLDERSSHNAKVFLSSSADFTHPGAGENLVAALKRELAESSVVLLVFTSEGEGWSWCMWECGVATDPRDESPSKVVVLQCSDAAPAPYGDHVRVDLRNLDAVTGFVRKMLTTNDWFPDDQPLTGYSSQDSHIRDFAQELHAELGAALADLRAPDVIERWASAYLCVEFEKEMIDLLKASPLDAAAGIVGEHGRVVRRQGASALFGFHLDANTTLGKLAEEWEGVAKPVATGRRWFESLAEQIRTVACAQYPVVPWAPFSVETSKAVIPYVAGSRTVPSTGAVQMLVYFVPMSPRPVPVRERMISPQQMFHKNLADSPGESILLVDLLGEMKADGRTRVPMLGEQGHPRFMVHLSKIVEYVSDRAINGDGDVKALTVHDLLDDPARADTYRSTFAVVDPNVDMDQALASMNALADCQDVFVTADGTKDSPVLGWITNTMFTT